MKHADSKSSRILSLLSHHEFRAIRELDLGDISYDLASGTLNRHCAAKIVRCRRIMMKNVDGSCRLTKIFALGKPNTAEEREYAEYAGRYQARKHACTNASIKQIRAKKKNLPSPPKPKPASQKRPVYPELAPRLDPMVWMTAGKRIPKDLRECA